ncbi:DUF4468 domain-containing protein [Elizabethkingia anophelis]|uniref:DUF4468 domain-containing protein n=1 Tax=Elizabethkingia anophelis TaxID=1117645 RepID=UPI0038925CF9
MKNVFTFLALSLSIIGFCQGSKFEIGDNGMNRYVVTDVPDNNSKKLHDKVYSWISKTYNDPKKVIKADLEEYIRIEGIESNIYTERILLTTNRYDIKYQLEISIKDNKYKFEIVKMEYYIPYKPNSAFQGWYSLNIKPMSEMIDKKGELKGAYKNINKIPEFFNGLNLSLKEYIEKEETTKSSNDW